MWSGLPLRIRKVPSPRLKLRIRGKLGSFCAIFQWLLCRIRSRQPIPSGWRLVTPFTEGHWAVRGQGTIRKLRNGAAPHFPGQHRYPPAPKRELPSLPDDIVGGRNNRSRSISVAPTCAPACGSRLRRLARGLYAVGFRTTHHRFEINGEECHRLQLVELSAVSRR
jgi:hypothetical protein